MNSLESLKVGDKVKIQRSSPMAQDSLGTISRLTKTQLIVGKEKFKRDTGRRIGDRGSWYCAWASIPTKGDIKVLSEAHEKRMLINKITSCCDWKHFTLDELIKVNTVLKEIEIERSTAKKT